MHEVLILLLDCEASVGEHFGAEERLQTALLGLGQQCSLKQL
jgi:hypothetical protein